MKAILIIIGIILLVLHQDFWNWNNATLVFGFVPMGLFYHILFSLFTGFYWFMVVKLAWPYQLEEGDK